MSSTRPTPNSPDVSRPAARVIPIRTVPRAAIEALVARANQDMAQAEITPRRGVDLMVASFNRSAAHG